MTIDEAIEDLTKLQQFCGRVNWKTHTKSIKLGIEALEGYKCLRANPELYPSLKLPGETKD